MKLGIALGGGGSRGVAHIGVLRVLESANVSVDLIAGTSAGAIVGALYAAGKSPDEIEQIARGLRLAQWLTPDRSHMGVFSTRGIRRILEKEIGKDTRIENLRRPFAAVTVDLRAQKEIALTSGSVIDAVCASSAIPGFFAPDQVGERRCVDGGVLNPVPFDVVRGMGADCVIAVDLGAEEPFFTGGDPQQRRKNGWLFRLLFTAEQMQVVHVPAQAVGIMTRQLREQKLRQSPPDLMLHPQVATVGLMDFDLMNVCLLAGEQAAREAMPQLEALLKVPRRTHWRKWFDDILPKASARRQTTPTKPTTA